MDTRLFLSIFASKCCSYFFATSSFYENGSTVYIDNTSQSINYGDAFFGGTLQFCPAVPTVPIHSRQTLSVAVEWEEYLVSPMDGTHSTRLVVIAPLAAAEVRLHRISH